MQLYEISGLGYHTPLSSSEIAKLFREGRLHREVRCKGVDAKNWRTVDELFPLLKYGSPAIADHGAREGYNGALTQRHLFVAVAAILLVAVGAFAAFLLYQRSVPPAPRPTTSAVRPPRVRSAPHVSAAPGTTLPPRRSVPAAHVQARVSSTPAVVQVPPAQSLNSEGGRRFVEERLWREQEQRDQAVVAERLREKNAREAAEKQRDAGKDTILPLDEYGSVYVGGSWVSVKVHDNDVTSFDAWVNGAFYDDVRKQKGMNGSRTDETFIYGNGRATLYYVWELSGKLNHCRLRVREQ